MIKRKKPIRRVSKKRAVEMKQYSALRKQFLADHPICGVWLKENSWREFQPGEYVLRLDFGDVYSHVDRLLLGGADPSEEVHHKARRGKNYLNTDTWLAVSSRNHKRIEGQSTYDGKPYGMSWARASGFLL